MPSRRRYELRELLLEERDAYLKARAEHPSASLGGVSEHLFAMQFDTGLEIIVTSASSSNGSSTQGRSRTARSATAAYAHLRALPRARNLWLVSPGSGTRTKIHY